eukprot:5402033-Pleurochrysis_carterae.AAC.1
MTQNANSRRGAGGPKDCKCGKEARGARQEGHERGQEARTGSGEELASTHVTKYTGPQHVFSSSARGGDHIVSVHSDLPSNC